MLMFVVILDVYLSAVEIFCIARQTFISNLVFENTTKPTTTFVRLIIAFREAVINKSWAYECQLKMAVKILKLINDVS